MPARRLHHEPEQELPLGESTMRRRQAFTLVELLVTIALVVFIMTLLSEAFIIGLNTFRELKAIGDMDERLRSTTTQMLTDLQADHVEARRRLGDPNFWASGPPREGFFRIYAPSAPMPPVYNGVGARPASYIEGLDGDGIPSAVVTDTVLHFSVKLRGNRQDRFFSATNIPASSPLLTSPTTFVEQQGLAPDSRYQVAGGTSYNSQWAEVAYFLVLNGDIAGLTPLYTLYRTQLVVAPDTTYLNWLAPGPVPIAPGPDPLAGYEEMSCEVLPPGGAQVYFNNPSDLAGVYNGLGNPTNVAPVRAFDPTNKSVQDPNTGLPRASTFVMGDVISFEVQALTATTDVGNPASPPALALKPVNFDTGVVLPPQTMPTSMTIRAVQITLRVWDSKTQRSRQITIVQDL
jgi:hypothetical protein